MNCKVTDSIQVVYNDGGREAAGYRGKAGDCGLRAYAIAARVPYQEAYDDMKDFMGFDCAMDGIYRDDFHNFVTARGFAWTPTMRPGSGCKVHLRKNELPEGYLIVRLSRHYAAVIDGTLYDTYDSSRNGTRCVYGYWKMI